MAKILEPDAALDLGDDELIALGNIEAELQAMPYPTLEAVALSFVELHTRFIIMIEQAEGAAQIAKGVQDVLRAKELLAELRKAEFQMRTAMMIARNELRARSSGASRLN